MRWKFRVHLINIYWFEANESEPESFHYKQNGIAANILISMVNNSMLLNRSGNKMKIKTKLDHRVKVGLGK